jgi:hypothetical protein
MPEMPVSEKIFIEPDAGSTTGNLRDLNDIIDKTPAKDDK